MRALRTFTVRARLPEALAPLQELAFNLRWSWDERSRELFRSVDPAGWERAEHDPVRLLSLADGARLEQLAGDGAFLGELGEVRGELARYLSAPRWFQGRAPGALRAVAYFSPEFGIAEALPQYSGGLGVLAGDHLKASSDLGVPLTGVGLMYRMGYFRQHLNGDGWQEERYPRLDPYSMALELVPATTVEVAMAGETLSAKVWLAQVGRVPLYLLDADVEANSEDLRAVTDRLYGGEAEHRIRQEVLLGIGGVRALAAVGAETQVFHTNEGHAGFLGLERIRLAVTGEGLSWPEAIEAVRAGTVFTTHTPVPAGIDRFPRELMARYFGAWADEVGVSLDELMALGHFPGEPPDAPFNMAVMGVRLAGASNGVSRLHGDTSRRMFQSLWPSVPPEETPIGSITNGVHGRTWVAPAMEALLAKYVSPAWDEARAEEWAPIGEASDDEVWRARERGREALVSFVRARLHGSLLAAGVSATDASWTGEVLDPRYLIVGFARRFAAYKRATLLLSQPDRLRALLVDEARPLQLVFAGKAHPADDVGKQMIAEITRFAADPAVRHRIVFVEDYDISVAAALYQGCDVWLNTPRRPMEASGTSGEKAALNGALNCSILDGWWDEMFDGDNGWAISSAESYEDLARRDAAEAESLFDILERQVVPLFYDSVARFPRRWVRQVKASLQSLGPKVLASRMVAEYVATMYEPIAERSDRLGQDRFAAARELARWKAWVAAAWPDVSVSAVDGDGAESVDLGERRVVTADVRLGGLRPDDVAVQLLHGILGAGDELTDTEVVEMVLAGEAEGVRGEGAGGAAAGAGEAGGAAGGAEGAAGGEGVGRGPVRYRGELRCTRPGRHGYTVRVIPSHPDLFAPLEMGCVAWA